MAIATTLSMTLRKTRETARQLAADLDATIEFERTGSVETIQVDAPVGKRWVDGWVTALCITGRPTLSTHRIEMWQDAIDRMRAGLTDDNEEE